MLKTPLLALFVRRLEALNDQLSFFRFIEHEFLTRLSQFGPGVAQAYSTDLFAGNPFAAKIHVPLSKLPEFQARNARFTFASYFATSYETAAQFFREAESFLLRGTPSRVAPATVREGPEDRYRRVLSAFSLSPAPDPVLHVFSYCRLRRNALVHLAPVASPAFIKFASLNGAALNAHWTRGRDSIDFTVPSVAPLGFDDAITLLKLMRIGVQTLDSHLSSVCTTREIARLIALRRFDGLATRMNAEVLEERTRIIRADAKSLFGQDPGLAEAQAAASTIGSR